MDLLTLFGLAAVTAMLIFYAFEDRSPWFSLALVRAWLGPRLPARRLAIWRRRGHLGAGCGEPMAGEDVGR
jgi:hypothetical protein